MSYPILIFAALALVAMVDPGSHGQGRGSLPAMASTSKQDFDEFQRRYGDQVFKAGLEAKTRQAVSAYESRSWLPNGLRYGDSVRSYTLSGKSSAEVVSDMHRIGCAFRKDVLRDPERHAPKAHEGRAIPLWIFLCPDGGVIRIKPQGDPTHPWRPQPHGSKSLRYPHDAKFENFSDELVKIDEDGNALPKSRADLGPQHLVDGWSMDAHMDLRK